MRRTLRGMVCLNAMLLALTACGGGGGDAEQSNDNMPSTRTCPADISGPYVSDSNGCKFLSNAFSVTQTSQSFSLSLVDNGSIQHPFIFAPELSIQGTYDSVACSGTIVGTASQLPPLGGYPQYDCLVAIDDSSGVLSLKIGCMIESRVSITGYQEACYNNAHAVECVVNNDCQWVDDATVPYCDASHTCQYAAWGAPSDDLHGTFAESTPQYIEGSCFLDAYECSDANLPGNPFPNMTYVYMTDIVCDPTGSYGCFYSDVSKGEIRDIDGNILITSDVIYYESAEFDFSEEVKGLTCSGIYRIDFWTAKCTDGTNECAVCYMLR